MIPEYIKAFYSACIGKMKVYGPLVSRTEANNRTASNPDHRKALQILMKYRTE